MADSIQRRPVRVGTVERDVALDRLRDAFAHGQLTQDEFDERVDSALAAKTQDDLDELLADLPSAGTDSTSHNVPAVPQPPSERSWWRPLAAAVVAVFALGGLATADAVAIMGGSQHTLRAPLDAGAEVDVVAVMGGVEVVVPDGTYVDLGGLSIMGGTSCDDACRGDLPDDAPTVEVDAWTLMGGADILTESEFRQEGD